MSYLTEFPEFETSEMPVMPEGFIDQSWHNNSKPHWEHEGKQLALFVEHSDSAQREYPATRFQLYDMNPDGGIDDVLFESEYWAPMERFIAAYEPSHGAK